MWYDKDEKVRACCCLRRARYGNDIVWQLDAWEILAVLVRFVDHIRDIPAVLELLMLHIPADLLLELIREPPSIETGDAGDGAAPVGHGAK